MSYIIGGGGGEAGENITDPLILDKPFDLYGITPETLEQINEMFSILFKAQTRTVKSVTILEEAASSIEVSTFETIIPHSQILVAFTTPVQITPAPGEGKYIAPFLITVKKGTFAVAYTNNPNWTVRWGSAGPTVITINALAINTAAPRWNVSNLSSNIVTTSTNITNTPLFLGASSDGTLGDAGNLLYVKVFYCIIDVGAVT